MSCNDRGIQWGNERGIGLIEVVLAMFLVTVAIMAILSLQPSAWQTAGKSDFLGRAAEILHKEMETTEAFIMNPCNVVNTGTTTRTVYPSGLGAATTGDLSYTVSTTVTNTGANVWTVSVGVSWTGHAAITAILTVTRQEGFRYPEGCV